MFAPLPKNLDVSLPIWKTRLNDEPDIYLLVSGSEDMGIKWREGELQIKGRISCCGTQVFCGRHQGKVERWIKWSYKNVDTLSAYKKRYRSQSGSGLITVCVYKIRALRKIRLDTITGQAQEVDAQSVVDRGINFELTDLTVAEKAYCSLAFEAFPNDSTIDTAFTETVEAFLDELKIVDLTVACSQSYPSWLNSII